MRLATYEITHGKNGIQDNIQNGWLTYHKTDWRAHTQSRSVDIKTTHSRDGTQTTDGTEGKAFETIHE